MKRFWTAAASAALLMTLSMVLALPAQAAVDTSWCATPLLTQPFAPWGDLNWYELAPGQDASGFNGTGWTLSGGARIEPTTLLGGAPGTALDLPSGAVAVSPALCVTSDYPTARAMIQQVTGSDGVSFAVSYENTSGWSIPRTTGLLHIAGSAWGPSGAVQMQPANVTGWQIVRIVLTSDDRNESRLSNLFVDPRMGH